MVIPWLKYENNNVHTFFYLCKMPIRPITAAMCLDVAVGKYAARGASGNRTLMLAPIISSGKDISIPSSRGEFEVL